MRSDSGAPRHVRTIAAPVFLADDAVAAPAVSLPAAERSANHADALAAHTTGAVVSPRGRSVLASTSTQRGRHGGGELTPAGPRR